MNDLLRRYIVEIINESPQIVEDEVETETEVNEFSGVGAIAGFTAPLGMSGVDMQGPGVKERKKRKKSAWK